MSAYTVLVQMYEVNVFRTSSSKSRGCHLTIAEFSWEWKTVWKCHLIHHIISHSAKYGNCMCTVLVTSEPKFKIIDNLQ